MMLYGESEVTRDTLCLFVDGSSGNRIHGADLVFTQEPLITMDHGPVSSW